MATTGIIGKLPGGQVEIRARRRLNEPGAFEAFIDEFQNTIMQLKEADPNVSISDFDVSQNKLTPEQFEAMFGALTATGVKVQRFRMFGCAGLNDEALRHLSDHFAGDLTSETAPSELHLSDCAITADGFTLLMSVIEEKELYPTTIMPHRTLPLYLRLENNYIDETFIQEKVDLGVIRAYKKTPGGRQEADGIKVNLVVRQDSSSFQQKEGPPPSLEDAPPPKEVHDKWGDNKWGGKWGGKGSNQQQPPWGGKGGWQPAPRAARPWGAAPGNAIAARVVGPPGGVRPLLGFQQVMRPAQAAPRATIPARVGANPWQAGGMAKGAGRGQADRSRTPVGRAGNTSGPAPPTKPPPKGKGLPAPWEEHWSDEYQIPYFWNTTTGEALWEKPTA